MQLRLAWLGDHEDGDSYSAREARIVLRAFAKQGNVIPLWLAVGSRRDPHLWNGVHVFPVPRETLGSHEVLDGLVQQQRPDIIVTSLPYSNFSSAASALTRGDLRWYHRLSPSEARTESASPRAVTIAPNENLCRDCSNAIVVPFIDKLDPAIEDGVDPSRTIDLFTTAFLKEAPHERGLARESAGSHIVVRHPLFCNSALSEAMFELTYALLELGVPTVPQDELPILRDEHTQPDRQSYEIGAPKKYARIRDCLSATFDPERAVTVHCTSMRDPANNEYVPAFSSLSGREVLYASGCQKIERDVMANLSRRFHSVLACSHYVLQRYLDAGLNPRLGMVVPYGIDPAVYWPGAKPQKYPSAKTFRFLQVGFPWIHDKGFDLTIKAFRQAFSSDDDVTLILKVPRIRSSKERSFHFEPLESLVRQERAKSGSPEITLMEQDIPLAERGGTYTGADCYVQPLRVEGFGISILQAMACGLPVIATPWSGPKEFVSAECAFPLRHSYPIPGGTEAGSTHAYHVEPDVEHLAYLMRYVYEHQDEALALGQKAAALTARNWTWKQAAERLALLLNDSRLQCS